MKQTNKLRQFILEDDHLDHKKPIFENDYFQVFNRTASNIEEYVICGPAALATIRVSDKDRKLAEIMSVTKNKLVLTKESPFDEPQITKEFKITNWEPYGINSFEFKMSRKYEEYSNWTPGEWEDRSDEPSYEDIKRHAPHLLKESVIATFEASVRKNLCEIGNYRSTDGSTYSSANYGTIINNVFEQLQRNNLIYNPKRDRVELSDIFGKEKELVIKSLETLI